MTKVFELLLLVACRASAAMVGTITEPRLHVGPPPARFLRNNQLRGDIGLLPVDASGLPR